MKFFALLPQLIIYLCFLAILSIVFLLDPQLDIAISALFYTAETNTWYGKENSLIQFMYTRGTYVLGSTLLLSFSAIIYYSWIRRARAWVLAGQYIITSALLGPGLLVNLILKEWVGRPRPYETTDFGGLHPFTPLFELTALDVESFPSGHAASAWFFSVFFFLLYPRSAKWGYAAYAFSLAFGAAMSFARVSEGGHFASDVLWSFGLVNAVNALVYFGLLRMPQKMAGSAHQKGRPIRLWKKRLGYGVIGGLFLLAVAGTLFNQRVEVLRSFSIPLAETVQELSIEGNFDQESVDIFYHDQPDIGVVYWVHNGGYPGSHFELRWQLIKEKNKVGEGDQNKNRYGEQATLRLSIHKTHPQWDRTGQVRLWLPKDIRIIKHISAFRLNDSHTLCTLPQGCD